MREATLTLKIDLARDMLNLYYKYQKITSTRAHIYYIEKSKISEYANTLREIAKEDLPNIASIKEVTIKYNEFEKYTKVVQIAKTVINRILESNDEEIIQGFPGLQRVNIKDD